MSKEQKMTLMVAVTTAFLTTFMSSSLNLSIPNIGKEFSTGAAAVGWVVTIYMFACSSINVPMGKIADARGRKKMLKTGIALFTVSSIAGAFSVSIWMLLGCRLVQGTAASMLFATNNAILLDAFPKEKHGTALGKSVAATYTGLSLGPVIGGILNHYFGWRSVFFAATIIGVIALSVAARGLTKDENITPAEHHDTAGSLLYMAMIMSVIFGLTNLTVSRYAWMVLTAGIILCIMFVRTEMKAEDPIIRVTMFSEDSIFTLSNIAALLNYAATFAISYLLSIYLQQIAGYSSQTAGLILIAQPIVMALLSPGMGKYADRIAPWKLATGGMGIITAGLLAMTQLGKNTPLAVLIGLLLFVGIGFAMFSSPNTKAIMSRVAPKDYGVANSITATMRNMGQSVSMAIVTIVMGIYLGSSTLQNARTSTLLHSMKVSFIVFVVLSAAGTLMSMKRGGSDQKKA